MTVDFAELLAKHIRKPGGKCTVRTMLDQLDADTRKEVVAALASTPSTVPHSALVRVFTDMGYKLAAGTVSRHRRHECDCPHD